MLNAQMKCLIATYVVLCIAICVPNAYARDNPQTNQETIQPLTNVSYAAPHLLAASPCSNRMYKSVSTFDFTVLKLGHFFEQEYNRQSRDRFASKIESVSSGCSFREFYYLTFDLVSTTCQKGLLDYRHCPTSREKRKRCQDVGFRNLPHREKSIVISSYSNCRP